MHAYYRHSGVYGAHPEPGGEQRTEAGSTWHIAVVHEDLVVDPGGAQRRAIRAGERRFGCSPWATSADSAKPRASQAR